MAVNKSSPSQAEQAAKYKSKKATAAKKTEEASAKTQKRKGDDPRFSGQGTACVVTLIAFILFCVMAFNPEGKILQLLRDGLLGLFGKGAFSMAIPGLLFLFISFVQKTPKPVRFQTNCILGAVLLYGILHHLVVNDMTFDKDGLAAVSNFFYQGILGKSGGLLCGFAGFFLRWAVGRALAFVMVLVIAILLLLAAMDVTIPRVLRAMGCMDPGTSSDGETPGMDASERVARRLMDARLRSQERYQQRKEQRRLEREEMDEEEEWDQETSSGGALLQLLRSRKKAEQPAPVQEEAMPARRRVEMPVEPAEEIFREPTVVREAPVEPMPVVEPDPAVRKVTANEAAASAAEVAAEIARTQKEQKSDYRFPAMDMLKMPSRNAADGTSEMKKNTIRLNETLESFKIDAHIINVTRGPSVTRYEVELDKGVRLNKLTSVADDIALSLGVASVRIAPVPGKISVVGIEVPNHIVTNVNLREVIDSKEFQRSASKSTFAVGKDIGGNCIVGNIAKMPHLLIAGTTGSGKSVCMNSIIISLLYKASPDDVKLIMVDPKMVELGIYNDIPHLLIPVVTDPKKAAGSLQWAVTEMMRRYKLMSDAGVRDLESFNSIIESEGEGEKLAKVVVIIDELADLMLVAAKEVEDSICRIAQMGRAAGMHLIIATQRPSADVITGLMKANIPSRIAFAVASAMESRIILDTQGAEKLVGRGDMLYAPIGTGKPQRIQGCFVTDEEVEAVATFVKGNCKAVYDENVMDEIEKSVVQTGKKNGAPEPEANADEMEGDELLPDAVDVILETGQASVSMLQRRLKLGYARAARIVDEMEEKGIVGPFQGSKPRTILITKDQWADMKAAMGLATANDIPFDMDEA